MDPVTEALRWAPLVGGVAASALPWAKVWRDGKKLRDERKVGAENARIDLIKIAEEISAKQLARLYARVEALEAELTELRREHAQTVASKDMAIEAREAKIAFLEQQLQLREGENRQLRATVASYDQLLTKHDIDHIPPAQTVFEFRENRALLRSGPLPETGL